jgi:hypothetical protein
VRVRIVILRMHVLMLYCIGRGVCGSMHLLRLRRCHVWYRIRIGCDDTIIIVIGARRVRIRASLRGMRLIHQQMRRWTIGCMRRWMCNMNRMR